MSRIPIDLPPDPYPRRPRPRRRGNMLTLLLVFALVFGLTYLALEFL
jgi:hypothetical protein